MDSNEKKVAERVERMLLRDTPSQVPFNCTCESYQRMLLHCTIFDPGPRSFWGCLQSGAPVCAKVNWRTIWNRDGSLNASHVPVAYLYCSRCDKPPQVENESPIFADEIQTLAM